METALTHVPWMSVLGTMAKVAAAYAFMLLGVRAIGKRTFRGIGPQELILVTLLAKILGDNLVAKDAGMWANVAGGLTLFAMIYIVDRFEPLRHFVEGHPEVVFENGKLHKDVLARQMMSEADLERVAREYGRATYADFERITLEKDGRMTGILKKQLRDSSTAALQFSHNRNQM